MDTTRLIQARKYYDLVASGENREAAVMAVVGKKTPAVIENTEEYKAIVSAALALEKEELKRDIEEVKKKQIRSYSKLLEEGDKMIDEAEDIQDKILAHQNQRANLGAGVIERAMAWDGEDRNKEGYGDVLEGIILN